MRRAAILLLVAMALAACGKVGRPEPPQPDQYPQIYPKPEALPPGEHVPTIPIPSGPGADGPQGY